MNRQSLGSFTIVLLICLAAGCSPTAAPPATTPLPAGPPPAATAPQAPPKVATPAAGAPVTPPAAAANLPAMMWDAAPSIPAWASKQQDEPFDVTAFLESRAAPADNAAPLYFAALAELGGEMYVDAAVPAAWPWRKPTPTQVIALAKDIDNLANLDKLRAGTIPHAEVERVLAAARPAVEKLELAQQKPKCVFITAMNLDAMLPYAQNARSFARLAQIQMHYARATGDIDLAERTIGRTLRLSRDLRPRGLLTSQLVANAIDGVVLSTIREITLGQSQLDASRCDRLLVVLLEHEKSLIPSLTEGLQMEYISLRNTLDELQSGKRTFESLAKELELPPQGLERLKQVDLAAEIAATNKLFVPLLASAKLPPHQLLAEKPWAGELQKLKAEGANLTALLAPGSEPFVAAEARRGTQLSGLKCLLAVRRYYAAHNGAPPDLEIACREAGLAAVPTDAFSGQPMRFKMMGNAPIVYSVGTDGKDDGATVDTQGQPKPGDWLFTFKN